ncbi:hypothetical protein [Citrobacter farmeri]|nr:hypothetical protein [Citrobacter farmeri]
MNIRVQGQGLNLRQQKTIKACAHDAALARQHTDKINLSQKKTALHCTHQRVWIDQIFSFIFLQIRAPDCIITGSFAVN